MTATPVRALGYVRVSKAREEMISPELQVTAITDYCERSRAALVDVISDLDATGRNFARDGIQRLIERVEAGDANLVVVWKWSRFGRNVRDCLINIDRLEAAGGRLVAATEDFDDTPVGRFGRGQFLLMAQFESERIGEQWREAQARRLRNGLPYNGRPRYGYDYDKATGYTPNPVTSLVLRSLYEDYLGGATPGMIADRLNAEGHPAPQGGTWWDTTVQQVMETGFAAGLLRVATRTGPDRKIAKPRYEEGAHEPVISRDTWERYLRRRGRAAERAPRVNAPTHPFAGLVVCGSCGGPMYRTGGPDRICCSAYKQRRPCPQRAYTSLSSLEGPLKAWLATFSIHIDQRTKVGEEQRQGRTQARSQRKAVAREITKTEAALVRLTKSYAEGVIPTDTYLATRDTLIAQRDQQTRLLDTLSDELEALSTPAHRAAPNLLAEWDNLDALGKRDILAALVARIEVHPRGRGYKPTINIVPRWTTRT